MESPSWQRNGRIRERIAELGLRARVGAVLIGAVGVVAYTAVFMGGHEPTFQLQGAPAAGFEALSAAPDGWVTAIWADMGFIGVIGVFISLLVSTSGAARPGVRLQAAGLSTSDPTATLRTAIGVGAITYMTADVVENVALYVALDRVSGGDLAELSSWVFRAGSIAEVVKWGAIAATGILVVRLWSTSPPCTVPNPGPVRHTPDAAEFNQALTSDRDADGDRDPSDSTAPESGPERSGVAGYLGDALRRPFDAVRRGRSRRRALAAAAVRYGAEADQPTVSWGKPDDRPPVEPDAWDPTAERLGIAVSGGGIRSASLALGAFQELRAEGILEHARYVTSVSGGSYTTSALTAMNQWADGRPPPVDGFRPGSPEEQRLRRSLRYLLENSRTASSAVMRIVLGILINFAVLYALLFAFLRPVGWAVGTPFGHDELRVTEPIAISATDPEPLTCGTTDAGGCKVGPAAVAAGADGERQIFSVTLSAIDVDVTLRSSNGDTSETAVTVVAEVDGRVTVTNGAAAVTRQPRFVVGGPAGADEIVRVTAPQLSVTADATGFGDAVTPEDLARFIRVERAPSAEPIGLLERRGELEVAGRHWIPAAVLLAIAGLFAVYRTLIRPDNYKVIGGLGVITGAASIGWFVFFVAIPWLLVEIPARFVVADAGPNEALLSSLDWLPGDPGGLPPLLAWLLLAGTAISRFRGDSNKKAADTTPKKRNTKALLAKLMRRLQQIAVALALVLLVVGGALVVLAGGALNGPAGGHTLLARTLLGNDMLVWFVATALLVALTTAGESYGWSPGPVYKRQLSLAFHQKRDGDTAARRSYGDGTWTQFAPDAGASPQPGDERLGYVDGEHGDGTELVLCTAANVRGFGNTPAGREAVSFTVSRSWTGGPEIGWVPTDRFVHRMGRRRRWDVNLPGITALSGAAVSTSMGNKGFGPIGSFLALLNVRLGAWIPHPQHVNAMAPGEIWHHNPGWPWYVREVVRRHTPDARYLYVSDGGHWENFAIVEALRRGCTTIICIAAAGDGVYSLNTFGEAAEIARADLGVDITIDDLWKVRPKLADENADTLPSGRQYILNPGPAAEIGQAAEVGFAFGTFTYRDGTEGEILLLDAAMLDRLPPDVHSYAEHHPEFPDVSTGDQLFSDRDFESYRVLGRELVRGAFGTRAGRKMLYRIRRCDRKN